MKNFYEYLSGVKKEYKYKIKIAVPVTEEMMDKLENVLLRYDVLEISKPRRAILQHNKLDFPDMGPVETTSFDIVTERPLVDVYLRNDLSKYLNVSERLIRVRSNVDPVQTEERLMDEMDIIDLATNDRPEVSLLNVPELPEDVEVAYGNEYNQKLMDYLAKIRAGKVMDAEKHNKVPSMFGWLKDGPKTDPNAFNVNQEGLDVVSGEKVSKRKAESNKKPATTSNFGNYDNEITHASKTIETSRGPKKITSKGK